MKVLAVNSSLRSGGQSRTELMMDSLVRGMREAGAQVETVNLRDKKIGYCIGCFSCMTKTPGRCVLKDDMTLELYPRWLESDLCVYATPLFHWTVNAPMKTFIERTWPSSEPFFVPTSDGRWGHPSRHEKPDAVVLSVAGFTESWIFDGLSHYFRFLFGRSNKLLAEIYRPGAMAITQIEPDKLRDILDATVQGGRELVETRRVAPETLARIQQPVGDPETVARMANMFWHDCIDAGITVREFEERKMMPHPRSVEDYMAVMQAGFNPANARGDRATLQFNFSGEVEGECHLVIENGTLRVATGPSAHPDLVIHAPFDVWMDVISGKADGMRVFMEGKCRAEGEFSLLMKLNSWFGRQSGASVA